MKQNNIYILLVIIAAMVSSCKSTEIIQLDKLDKVKDDILIQQLDSLSKLEYSYFYSKLNTDFKDSSNDVSFKTSVRMINDSAVGVMITYASIPVINSIITHDSVQVSNKRDKCFVKEKMNFFKSKFGVDFTLQNIEEILLGKPLDFDLSNDYHQLNDPYNYILSSHKKKERRRMLRNTEKDIVLYYTLTDDLKGLKNVRIESIEDSTNIYVNYNTWENIEGRNVPDEMSIEIITPTQTIKINLDSKKVRLNNPEEIHFVIPEGYEKCK